MLAQGMSKPTNRDMDMLIWATRYLKGTRLLAAKSDPKSSGPQHWRHFCDSDQGGDTSPENKGRSRSGYITMAGDFPIQYKSKATSVAMAHRDISEAHSDISSAACETFAAANATYDILYVSYCAEEMGIEFPLPFVLEMDNHAAEVFCNNSTLNSRLRHIDARQHWVKTLRDSNVVVAKHVDTKLNVADIFTKP